ncbi:MAG: UbiH/UbiF family hydroxylase [Betaproteobacteria bacterium]
MSADGGPRDVIIVGAGLVGLALAAALARAGLSVTIVDRGNVATTAAPRDADGDGWDQRVYAISPGSASFLHSLGAWQLLPAERIAPIEAMDVRGDADGRIEFSAYELGERALAWIVESRALNAALVQASRGAPGIDIVAPCTPAAIAWRADGAELRLDDGRTLSARLIVGADGVHSWTRAEAGMRGVPRAYGQSGIVANFDIERAHRGRAFQWFLTDGSVLAWLPLPGRRISIVWSAPAELAAELMALDAASLAARVAEAGGHELGTLTTITPAAAFELSFLKLPAVVADRLALVGDAAHGVHPLAGQGVNLGFGDAAALAAILGARGPVTDAGAGILLERYARRRAGPVLAMQAVTDGLVRLFDVRASWLRVLRNRGMRAVGAVGPLKRLLAQPALR